MRAATPTSSSRRSSAVPADAPRGGRPLTWKFDDDRGRKLLDDGEHDGYHWDEVALDPGWCKLDWVVTDPERTQLSNASNVIDVTWEGPDGEIVPLDGYLDAYFQEVYLEADDLPMFAKVAKFVTDDALDEYVDRLEEEVRKYLTDHLNYGKAAKRMYNVFRLSGRHLDAAFVRELFDEPATILYQVGSLIVTLDNATAARLRHPDRGRASAGRRARDRRHHRARRRRGERDRRGPHAPRPHARDTRRMAPNARAEVEAAQARVVNLVNTFFATG